MAENRVDPQRRVAGGDPARTAPGRPETARIGTPASWAEDGCGCREQLVGLFADRGIDMVVSSQPPLVPSPYEDLGMRCPHGTRWYTEPTSDQQAAWAAAAVGGGL